MNNIGEIIGCLTVKEMKRFLETGKVEGVIECNESGLLICGDNQIQLDAKTCFEISNLVKELIIVREERVNILKQMIILYNESGNINKGQMINDNRILLGDESNIFEFISSEDMFDVYINQEFSMRIEKSELLEVI